MIKPIEDKVVVKVAKEEEKTSTGGLILTSNDEKPNQATVVAVGAGMKLPNGDTIIPDVAVGDTVVFAKYSGTEITVDGEDYLVLAYRDVLAVIG